MHICSSKRTIIGSNDGLLPGQRQAIILTNARMLLIQILGTDFNEILSEIQIFSFTKMHAFENVICEMAAILSHPQCVKTIYVQSVYWHN